MSADEAIEVSAPALASSIEVGRLADAEDGLEEAGVGTAAAEDQRPTSSAAPAESRKKRSQRTKALLALLLICAVVGLAVGLTVGRNGNTNSDSSSSLSPVDLAVEDMFDGEDAPETAPKEKTPEDQIATLVTDPTVTNGEFSPTISPRDLDTPRPTSNIDATAMPWVDDNTETARPWVDDDWFQTQSPTTSQAPTMVKPLVDRSCEYAKRQTVAVTSPSYDALLQSSPSKQTSSPADEGRNITKVYKRLSGGASAFDGNTAVIVSYSRNGTAGGVWAITKTETEGDGTEGEWVQSGVFQTIDSDQLGWDVSIKGRTFVVGAPGYIGNEIYLNQYGWYWAGRGMAMVMRQNDEGKWEEEGRLVPNMADYNADFGTSVDVAECECLIAVGAWHDRDSRGSAYVFSRDSDTGEWTELQKLAPETTRRTQSEHFHGNYGYSVSITDNYLAVKAPYDSYAESEDWIDPDRGVVHVYRKGGDGTFEEWDRLHAPEGAQARTHLSQLCFLDEEFLLVGAPGRNRVYVFEATYDFFEKTAELRPSDPVEPDNLFGVSVDCQGRDVFVGDKGGQRSYLFRYENGAWSEKTKFDGFNTALSGNSVIVEHTPVDFRAMDGGSRYGGDVNFYDLVCEQE